MDWKASLIDTTQLNEHQLVLGINNLMAMSLAAVTFRNTKGY
jgi:hypothetical protein